MAGCIVLLSVQLAANAIFAPVEPGRKIHRNRVLRKVLRKTARAAVSTTDRTIERREDI